jgi:hypothetical protein
MKDFGHDKGAYWLEVWLEVSICRLKVANPSIRDQ